MTAEQDIKWDVSRPERVGMAEAVFCPGKVTAHLVALLDAARTRGGSMLLTRLERDALAALPSEYRDAIDYDELSRTGVFGKAPELRPGPTHVAIVAAGTSDSRVAREAERTLAHSGVASVRITDVGVAGLWRLMERIDEIRSYPIVIACAGMDAALPTVLGGLVASVVIAVPTSVGYGIAENGETALRSSLASCSQGVAVMNIDNGFGGACTALRVLRAMGKLGV